MSETSLMWHVKLRISEIKTELVWDTLAMETKDHKMVAFKLFFKSKFPGRIINMWNYYPVLQGKKDICCISYTAEVGSANIPQAFCHFMFHIDCFYTTIMIYWYYFIFIQPHQVVYFLSYYRDDAGERKHLCFLHCCSAPV